MKKNKIHSLRGILCLTAALLQIVPAGYAEIALDLKMNAGIPVSEKPAAPSMPAVENKPAVSTPQIPTTTQFLNGNPLASAAIPAAPKSKTVNKTSQAPAGSRVVNPGQKSVHLNPNLVHVTHDDGSGYFYFVDTGKTYTEGYDAVLTPAKDKLVYYFVTTSGNSNLAIYDIAAQTTQYQSLGSYGFSGIKAVSPDGKYAVTASSVNTIYITPLQDLTKPTQLVFIPVPQGETPTSHVLTQANFLNDNLIQFKLANGKEYFYFIDSKKLHHSGYDAMLTPAKDKLVYHFVTTSGNSNLAIYDIAAKTTQYQSLGSFGFGGIKAVSPDGKYAVTASSVNTIYITPLQDLTKPTQLVFIPVPQGETPTSHVLTQANFLNDNLIQFKLANGKEYFYFIDSKQLVLGGYDAMLTPAKDKLLFYVVSGSGNANLAIYTIATKVTQYKGLGSFGFGGIKAVSPDGQYAIVASSVNTIYSVPIADPAKPTQPIFIPVPPFGSPTNYAVTSVVFLSNTTAVITTKNGMKYIFNPVTGALIPVSLIAILLWL